MGYQISPGINVSEIDLTTVVPSVLTTAGAFAGTFKWGPAGKVTLVDSEITLSKTFGTPDSNSAISFFTAANFLSYGNNLSVVRAIGANSFNADANTLGSNIQVSNSGVFQYTLLNSNNNNAYGAWMARYPGALGNSLSVSVCANTSAFSTWTYNSYFSSAPTTSGYVSSVNGSNDEMHVAVIDTLGLFSGTSGTVLETFPFVSKASDAVNLNDGSSNYYKQVIFNNSKYIYAVDPVDYANTSTNWGTTSSGKTFFSPASSTISISGGTDDVVSDANKISAFQLFSNKETIDISLVLTGDASVVVQQDVIDNVVNSRADCVAFISPPQSAVVNQSGNETTNIQTWLTSLARNSSYVVADSGWKYQFDVYNNVYRWIPLNGDIAGLCVYTDAVTDPWYSPAGFNRGAIKNAVKLSWNPSKTYRDTLYAAGVNPVVSFSGQGIVLFGDKTLQNKPSAFDHINVRRLFITLEKSISKAAQFALFEFNDEFTRAQFVALVTPFLRDVQGRRGITDFKVVCDTTNNTPQVIDSNQFVGDIYIKPARSINYIQLNFIAVGTGVDFNTIVGQATV
jgi:Phage tail sheath protein subtilisin-like domain/Phage tail sheath C-terminal domain